MKTRRALVKFIGIGHGSLATFIYDCIKEHPQTVVPKINTNFFSSPKQFAKGFDWYERNFCVEDNDERGGELAGNYLRRLDSAQLIAKNYPDARLLAVIDNPLLAIKVDYLRAKEIGVVPVDTTIENFIRKGGDKFLHRYFFGRQLSNYFGLYAPTDLMVVLVSDFQNSQLQTIKEIYEHFGLDKEFVPPILKYLVIDEGEEEIKKKSIIKKVFNFIKVAVIKYAVLVLNKFKKDRPDDGLKIIEKAKQISFLPEMEKLLRDYYRQDVKILSNLLHRDLSREWGFSNDLNKSINQYSDIGF